MYQDVTQLLLFGDLDSDCILLRLAQILEDWKQGAAGKAELIHRIYGQVKRLLDLATDYGFDENLWQNYLTFLLITQENSFTLTAERHGAGNGSVNHFAMQDFSIFAKLFHYDFTPVETDLGIDCFSVLTHYQALAKEERLYNKTVSQKVRTLSRQIAQARDTEEIFRLVTSHYARFGVGMLGLNRAFRLSEEAGSAVLCPINNLELTDFDQLVGYDLQKRQLIANTEAFLKGLPANNCLLYGDSGTGKSTCVKILVNRYYDQGLRMIELYKHQFPLLSRVISQIKTRNYKFIIFLDDLSFEEHEVEYKFLKAVIEGGVETRPDNVLIYATSNRRHLIRETWSDRSDMEHDGEIHRSDTLEEKLSLASRFGVAINFSSPDHSEFMDIVKTLARRQGITWLSEDALLAQANQWELRHGGLSGRTAQQFINYLAGQKS